MKRGEIYYIESTYRETGSEQRGGRPAVIVSNDKNNENSEVVEVVYMTTKPKNDLPTHVFIRSALSPSTVLCEQVNSVSVKRIGTLIGKLTKSELAAVDSALAISLQEERAAGIDMGLSLLAMCDELWVYGIENPSEGMRSEIEYAKQHQIPIRDAAELYRNREAETLPIGDALIVLPSHVGHLNGVAAIESTTVRINGEMILDLAIELRRHPGHDITLEADKGADSEVDQ